MVNRELIIHQALHGYDRGHGLLASSTEIPASIKKSLQILSDLSGPNVEIGFESYITGYPIIPMNVYAIAKTWYAQEMERPGCVWTHTVFLDFDKIDEIKNIDRLYDIFKRPDGIKDLNFYNKPIQFNNTEYYQNNISVYYDIFEAKNIVYNLYSHPNISIIICTNKSRAYEKLLLEIWFHQWKNLKKNFYFCSGSISSRSFNSKIFDLQIVPQKNQRKFLDIDQFLILNEVENYSNQKAWLNEVINSLGFNNKLNSFFGRYCTDIKPYREKFIPIINIFTELRNEAKLSLIELINNIGSNFPDPNEGLEIKKLLLNPSSEYGYWIKTEEVLKTLSVTEFEKSFSNPKLIKEINKIAIELWNSNQLKCEELLNDILNEDINKIGEEIVESLALNIKENDLLKISNVKLLRIFVDKSPEIATFKDIWQLELKQQFELLDDLFVNLDKTDKLWHDIITSILVAKSFELIPLIIDKLSSIAVKSVLSWIVNYSFSGNLDYKIVQSLQSRPTDILNWLELNQSLNSSFQVSNILRVLPEILDPNDSIIKEYDYSIWLGLLNNDIDFLNIDLINFKAFMLAIAFNYDRYESIDIMKYSFEDVYRVLLIDNLNYNSWKRLDIYTSPLKWYNKWDKCKKLRRALFDKFIQKNWLFSELRTMFKNQQIYDDIIEDFKTSKKYKKYIYLLN